MTIAIGRLHIGAVQPEWLVSWEELKKPTKPDGSPDWITWNSKRQIVHVARNDIVKATLEQHPEVTHLFFIDDDIMMPPDGLMQLLSRDLPVVTGLYVHRSIPMLPVVFRCNENGQHISITKFCDGLQQVDACGAGCLLIRTDVLRAIQATGEPWFDFSQNMSEDLAFCRRVRQLGYPIVLDFDVKCGHLTTLEITYEMFLQRNEENYHYGDEEIKRLSQEVRPWQQEEK